MDTWKEIAAIRHIARIAACAGLLAAFALDAAAQTAADYPAVPGIVDVSNRDWPREVETTEGVVSLDAPPQRILALSLGHDEMLLALVPRDRFAGVGPFTADPTYSNVAGQVAGMLTVKRGVENVLAAKPDIVVVSKYTKADLVALIKEAGVPVVRSALESSAAGNIPNILLLGYLLGVEERALELVAEIERRLAVVTDRVPAPGDPARPAVLSIARWGETTSAAGEGSTEGGIIETAGGVNAAARAGIAGHQSVSVESIAAMNPDVILITQPADSGGTDLREELLDTRALAEVPAIADERVIVADPRHYTTLSHWNVRGIEETARLLYPERFRDVTFRDFEPYGGS